MLVLGIETTCDETACAVVKDGKEILSNIISSQIDLHREYGGVVPELACRRHVDVIIPIIEEALKQANIALKDIDLFAVAHGPGLIGALLIGINTVKALAFALNKPFIGINHVEAHLYSALMTHPQCSPFPAIGAVLSGGHTALLHMKEPTEYTLIGETIDDAIGEAFDKTAKILGLPYPGGPEIERLALRGDPHFYSFKTGKIKEKPFHFSFSGLKTSVLYTVKKQDSSMNHDLIIPEERKKDVAASFQKVAFDDIIVKIKLAATTYQCDTIVWGGGVTNNQYLRNQFKLECPHLKSLWPSLGLSLDNAAMIAGLGYHVFTKKGFGDSLALKAMTRIPFI